MKFRIEEALDRPVAVFDDEQPPRSSLLSTFLEEARTSMKELLDKLENVRSGQASQHGYTGDGVSVEYYVDRAVIEELWPADEDVEPARIELPLDQARQLLLDWQTALNHWRRD